MRQLLSRLLLVLLLVGGAAAPGHALDLGCQTNTALPGVCFASFVPRAKSKPDPRIVDWLKEAQPVNGPIRSFAFVVGISQYPKFAPPDDKLDGVNVDLVNLLAFLKEQQFDEIIVLADDNATVDNINKVFNYLGNQVPLYRSRFLFAYDGHGTKPRAAGLVGGLALGASAGDGDVNPASVFGLGILRDQLETVAASSFQSVALLASCYSGGVFPMNLSYGEDYTFAGGPGAHAVTAADAYNLAWTSGPNQGTIFFDRFISSVRTDKRNDKDPSAYDYSYDPPRLRPHTVRLWNVVGDVNLSIDPPVLNPKTKQPYPRLRIGPILPQKANQPGTFFFLGYDDPAQALASAAPPPAPPPDLQKTEPAPTFPRPATPAASIKRLPPPPEAAPEPPPTPAEAAAPPRNVAWTTSANLGPNSATYGEVLALPASPAPLAQPVAFRLPESYRIRGVDLSNFNGVVNFAVLAEAGLRFAYVKATEGQRRDPSFARNWTGGRQSGLAIGAYSEVQLCKAADEQFEAIRAAVPKTSDALPVALAVEPDVRSGSLSPSCSPAFTRQLVGDLARKLGEYYGKKPIIYGNANTLSWLLDQTLTEFPIWLTIFTSKPPTFVGRNPWTLWQVTDRAQFAGVKNPLDLNVFFGTEEEFKAFSDGAGNVARKQK
jgi:GH25 family lysozyme M1 (1,4-beta-N-acetylmuramidase)